MTKLNQKEDMSHWDIYSENNNVLSEKKQLQHIMNVADAFYKHGHHSLAGFHFNEEIINALFDYASTKGIKLEAKNFNEIKYGEM